MSAGGAALRWRLLGVPVRLEADDPKVRERLAVCYALAPEPAPDAVAPPPLGTSIRRGAAGYEVRIEAREPTVAEDVAGAVRAFNHELLHALMRRRPGLFFVHAAVVARGGAAIVLPGVSQAGKSTLALALVGEGALYLSDELLVYDPAAGLVLPFPRSPKIRDVCLPAFPEWRDAFVGEEDGRFLPLPGALLSGPVPRADLRVVVPTFDLGGDDALRAIGRGEACLHLAASALNFGTHRARSLDLLQDLVDGAATFAVRWRDARRAARAVIEVLEGATP